MKYAMDLASYDAGYGQRQPYLLLHEYPDDKDFYNIIDILVTMCANSPGVVYSLQYVKYNKTLMDIFLKLRKLY